MCREALARTITRSNRVEATSRSSLRRSKAAKLVLVATVLFLAACSDATTAPMQTIDRVAAGRVMPSVTDARLRLAPEVENGVVRDRVLHDLQELELALTNGDAQKARFHVSLLATVLTDYRSRQSELMTDGADVTAIALVVYAVSQVVDAGFDVSAFR